MLRPYIRFQRQLTSTNAASKKVKDPLVTAALEMLRNYKPTEEKITDPLLLKKITAPTPPPVTPVPDVTKEELQAYVNSSA
ncbi:hypothetical protein HMI54_004629 [Coelomomyces lativittatus]|nr:hypothetical protein HMI56_000639 [Coelomomyces lativittatus]KAJ1506981.1 hypothetical protein HMI54_004629 [Coelomomyces lativittatus]KAJ1511178.1 hypothetical protein HMI55_006702 [Coelomomyces lativittatus]